MDVLEANQTLRFLKTSDDVPLRFAYLGSLKEVRVGLYTDASWASRPESSSQGGRLILVGVDARFEQGEVIVLVSMECTSQKLARKRRS